MFKSLSREDLENLYFSDYDRLDRKVMFTKFCNTYNVDLDCFDKSRFIQLNNEDLDRINNLAIQRFSNNRKENKKQVKTGCGEPSCYLDRDYPGVVGEVAFEKYISSLGLNNENDVDAVKCTSKTSGSDKGDFIISIKTENIKFEVKCNKFDKDHRKQNSLNVQYNQIQNMIDNKSKPDYFVQMIMVTPTLVYLAGFSDWFRTLGSIVTPERRDPYYAVPFYKIKYFNILEYDFSLDLD